MNTRSLHHAVYFLVFLAITLPFLLAVPALADHNININTADKGTLTTLTGIGEVKAQAIIDYRETSGPFATIEEIQNVSGIGPATFASIRDHIVVSGGSTSSPSPSPAPTPATPTPAPTPSTPQTVSSYVAPPQPELFADAGSDRTVVVGADVEFRARAYNGERELVENVRFSWNFGDGATAEGPTVRHHFAYPGRYAVVLTIAEHRDAMSDRAIVDVVPADLSISVLVNGGVAIENRGAFDLDLSRWVIRFANRDFILPENSFVLAGQAIRVAENTLGFFAGADTELRYPNGTLALHAGESAENVLPQSPPSAAAFVASNVEDEIDEPVIPSEPLITAEAPESTEEAVESISTSSQIAAVNAVSGSWKWWGGALIVSLLGAGAVYLARQYAKREWSIIEDRAE